ncbi:hypothetical protein [Novosphingobium sp.]|uniref:hypothetical protein n=1 Tax=Novosphingobium sp. TaxID=1874826 RepID=UPI002B46619E|nr:hypothetical protein [Novosphingobium sp.]HKR93647.1 hypothetical protein [Novosphingobium sp.]
MTKASPRLPPDPRRRARFREIARGIVAKDRHDRKYGYTVDTAGAIAQALERAYRDGVRDGPATAVTGQEQPDTTAPLEWALIPPRPRDAFWSICLFFLGREEADDTRNGHLEPALTERGTPGWAMVVPGRNRDKVIGDRTIGPLIRLGLLAHSSDGPVRLLVTERGQDTWRLFCQRGGRYPEDLTDI